MLRPFFSFYGGKWRAAPHYPVPKFDTIVEPFAGAAGYSVRHAERRIILIDADPIICGLWRYLIGVSSAEILRLPVDVQHVDDLGAAVPEEAKHLIGWWFNKGTSAPRKTPSRWMRESARPGGSKPSSWWGPEIRDRIARQVEHIRHWRVIEGDYTVAPNIAATWFVDPPYEKAGRLYRVKFKKHKELGCWARKRKGQVIVCENEGAEWLPFQPFMWIRSSSGKHGKTYSTEAIWTNDSEQFEEL